MDYWVDGDDENGYTVSMTGATWEYDTAEEVLKQLELCYDEDSSEDIE